MVEKVIDRDSGVALDLGRMLGFKRVAICAESQPSLEKALGGIYNKVGDGEVLKGPCSQLARALGATYNKTGETG